MSSLASRSWSKSRSSPNERQADTASTTPAPGVAGLRCQAFNRRKPLDNRPLWRLASCPRRSLELPRFGAFGLTFVHVSTHFLPFLLRVSRLEKATRTRVVTRELRLASR